MGPLHKSLIGASLYLLLVACGHGSSQQTLIPQVEEMPQGGQIGNAVVATSTTQTIPFWESSFSYPYAGKPHTWPFKMVGSDPMLDPVPTTVDTTVIPIRLVFSDGTTLDGANVSGDVASSPLFTRNNYSSFNGYPSGDTQYGDYLMRSEWWKYVASADYHVYLAKPVMEPAVQIEVPSADGYVKKTSSTTGYVTFAWFVQTIEPQVIARLRLRPSSLAIFITEDTDVLEAGNACCFHGYHYAYSITSGSTTQTFTTAWASVSTANVKSLSHEISEWLNDPFYTNVVPRWIQPGTDVCAGYQLEVGDPVVPIYFDIDDWVVQDEVFFSWFSRQKPSIALHGKYDILGHLTEPAQTCT